MRGQAVSGAHCYEDRYCMLRWDGADQSYALCKGGSCCVLYRTIVIGVHTHLCTTGSGSASATTHRKQRRSESVTQCDTISRYIACHRTLSSITNEARAGMRGQHRTIRGARAAFSRARGQCSPPDLETRYIQYCNAVCFVSELVVAEAARASRRRSAQCCRCAVVSTGINGRLESRQPKYDTQHSIHICTRGFYTS